MLWLLGYSNDGIVTTLTGRSICDSKSTGVAKFHRHCLFTLQHFQLTFPSILWFVLWARNVTLEMVFHLWWQFSLLLQVALDYIGKRGATVGVTKEKRIKYVMSWEFLLSLPGKTIYDAHGIFVRPCRRYAKEILQKEMLPHVGTGEFCETKKAYYFG